MSFEDAVIAVLDKRARTAVARVAQALPSIDADKVPGTADYVWSWTPPGDSGRDAYDPHLHLNGDTITGDDAVWSGRNFIGTAPYIGDHKGDQCVVDLEDVTVRVSASQPEVRGNTVVVHWQIGAEAGPFGQRYRGTALVPGGVGSLVPGRTDAQELRRNTKRSVYVRTAADLVRAAA